MFDRHNPGTVSERGKIKTARYGLAIHQHGTASAQALRAAFARAEQIEALAQDLDKGVVRFDVGAHLLAVEGKTDSASHFCPTNVDLSFVRSPHGALRAYSR